MNRSALTISLSAALLGGCGASQAPIGASGVTPPTSAIASAPNAASPFSTSFRQLFRFRRPNGSHPAARLLDVNGTLYGTTFDGGSSRKGTIYRVSTRGAESVLHSFRGGLDGAYPSAGLIDVKGTLYGTTSQGGGSGCPYGVGCGTVYSVSTSGAEKVLYAFKNGDDGASPLADLTDLSGTLYGTTSQGGRSACIMHVTGCGTVFKVTTSGKETVLHNFLNGSDGAFPLGDLIEVEGVLYGTTASGGSGYDTGTVFSITLAGMEKVLYAFQWDVGGRYPGSGLVDVDGMLYGTTSGGGLGYPGCSFGAQECGTVFRISTKGGEKVIYSFAGGSDGAIPRAALIELHGVLY
ncbi:MAG: choice-of-anchor tandem repeat GloVer-containing protein, partial [Candidatus Cybelea sp.]